MCHTKCVPNFMLVSQNAQLNCLASGLLGQTATAIIFCILITRGTPINRSIQTYRRRQMICGKMPRTFGDEWAANLRISRATGTVPERVRLCVHTTEPTGPIPEPFHCDHIARWSARSGTTGRSGTGVNTGTRLHSGPVPVPNLWCEHHGRRSWGG